MNFKSNLHVLQLLPILNFKMLIEAASIKMIIPKTPLSTLEALLEALESFQLSGIFRMALNVKTTIPEQDHGMQLAFQESKIL